jgi:hypothetical protein
MQLPILEDADLAALSRLEPAEACERAGSTVQGLSRAEAQTRLESFGPNRVSKEHKASIPEELWGRLGNPLNTLLLTLAIVSLFLGDLRAAVVILTMVLLAVVTAFIQEHRSNEAAARLRAMVHTRASIRRTPAPDGDPRHRAHHLRSRGPMAVSDQWLFEHRAQQCHRWLQPLGHKRMDNEHPVRAVQIGRRASETYKRKSAKAAQPCR